MSTYSYTLLKISWRVFGLNYQDLTDDQKNKVKEIYYNYC